MMSWTFERSIIGTQTGISSCTILIVRSRHCLLYHCSLTSCQRVGGTVLCTDGIGIFAKHLYDHPQGVLPSMKPVDMQAEFNRHEILVTPSLARYEAFHEATGQVGDVYLLHPLMPHSASRNLLRRQRVILNPPVSLKEPFQLSRADGKIQPCGTENALGARKVGRTRGLENKGEERAHRSGEDQSAGKGESCRDVFGEMRESLNTR